MLHTSKWMGYSSITLAKSNVRRGNLNTQTATHDAPRVFFCVHAYAYHQITVLCRSNSMVALVGQPKGWLVSVCASISTPANVTTPIERGNSGGDSDILQTEIIIMMTTPTHIQFKFLFLSVKRSDTTATPCRLEATALNEHDARLQFSNDYQLYFAGQIRLNTTVENAQ